MKALPFPLSRVQLLEGPLRDRQRINTAYLLEGVEPDRLLAGFREQAGLPPKAARYGGWEARGINGHSLGHYLSALAHTAAATRDPRALDRVNYIVGELAACQSANGDGYVLPVAKRVFEELRAGNIRASGFALNDEWVPIYTLHKVFAGLRDAWRLTGNATALEVERRLADYLAGILESLSPQQAQEILRSEHGGMNEVFADLSADTGDPRYLALARTALHHDAVLSPLEEGQDRLDGLHGNTQIPKVLGLARVYQLSGDRRSLRGASTFWDSVVDRRSFACGGHGCDEHFFPPARFTAHLSPRTAETCNTYNMIRLSGMLFSLDTQARRMDFVERGLLNHLLANIGRAPGEFGYFLGMGSVGYKIFSSRTDSWWCCVGTGMENPARYGEQIYFQAGASLWVNLFVASELDWSEQGVRFTQETSFPDSDRVRMRVSLREPKPLSIHIRHPAWCRNPSLTLNGTPLTVRSLPSSYLLVEREWSDGDTLELTLPMELRAEPLPHSEERILALMFGPLQLAAVVPQPDPENNPARLRLSDHLKGSGRSKAAPPVIVCPTLPELLAGIRPVDGVFAAFQTNGILLPEDLRLVPLHRIYEEHYAPYFRWFTPEGWVAERERLAVERERAARLESLTVDSVDAGYQQSEVEHGFRSERSETGDFNERKWRDVHPGGWFSYRLAVRPGVQLHLVTTHFGADRSREFELRIDDRVLVTVLPRAGEQIGFYTEIHPIPSAWTEGRSSVEVKLVATRMRAGTFGMRIVENAAVTEGLLENPLP